MSAKKRKVVKKEEDISGLDRETLLKQYEEVMDLLLLYSGS